MRSILPVSMVALGLQLGCSGGSATSDGWWTAGPASADGGSMETETQPQGSDTIVPDDSAETGEETSVDTRTDSASEGPDATGGIGESGDDSSVPGETGDDRDVPVPDPDCPTVARAAEIGCGRALVWGDEHIRFDDNYADSTPLWANAITWLADGSSCATERTHVHFGANPPDGLADDLELLGFVVTAGFVQPEDADIIVTDSWNASLGMSPDELAAWVDGGGAFMTMITGVGMGDPMECDEPDQVLEALGVQYSCVEPIPWDEIALADHAVTSGLTLVNTPFLNGRYVVDSGAGSVPVVFYGEAGTDCEGPSPPQ